MENTENKPTKKEYVVCNIVLIMLCALMSVPGFLAIAMFILAPACLSYIFIRFHLRHTILPVIITVMVPSLFSLGLNFSALLGTMPMAIMLSYAMKRRKGLLYTVSFGAVGLLVSLAISFAMSGGVEQLLVVVSEAIDATSEIYTLPGEYASMAYGMFTSLLPSIFICMAAACSYIAFYICIRVLKKADASYKSLYRGFCQIRADKTCMTAFTLFFILSMFTDGALKTALVNIVVILMSYTLVCGLSVAVFFAKKVKNVTARIFVYILLFATVFAASSIYLFIGVLDAFINIRAISKDE